MRVLHDFREGTRFDVARYLYAVNMLGFAGVGVQFGYVVLTGENPVTPDLYGPSVYAVPALFWAGAQVLCCSVAAIGCVWGERRGAAVAAVGSAPALLLFVLLWILALDAEQGTIVVAGNRSITAPITGALFWASLRRVLL